MLYYQMDEVAMQQTILTYAHKLYFNSLVTQLELGSHK